MINIPKRVKLLGWFLLDNWKYVLIALVALLIIITVSQKACGPGKVKLDSEAVLRMAKASEAERKAEIKEQLEKNADVVELVDGRTLDTVENIAERDKIIQQKVEEINREIVKRKISGDVTAEELERLLGGS